MKKMKGWYQGMRQYNGQCCFTILNSLFLILLLCVSHVAMAACVGTITASTPTVDFTLNGNGTVTYNKTGLTWKRCSEGLAWNGTTCTGLASTYTWQLALQQAKTLNNGGGYAGFTDWRVPNQKELNSIVETQCVAPSINATIFPVTYSRWYWSASPVNYYNEATAFSVYFGFGADSRDPKSKANYVRLVRTVSPTSGTIPGATSSILTTPNPVGTPANGF